MSFNSNSGKGPGEFSLRDGIAQAASSLFIDDDSKLQSISVAVGEKKALDSKLSGGKRKAFGQSYQKTKQDGERVIDENRLRKGGSKMGMPDFESSHQPNDYEFG